MLTSADRTRLHRERRRRGVVAVVKVEVTGDLFKRMIEAGAVTCDIRDGSPHVSRAAIAEAVQNIVDNAQ